MEYLHELFAILIDPKDQPQRLLRVLMSSRVDNSVWFKDEKLQMTFSLWPKARSIPLLKSSNMPPYNSARSKYNTVAQYTICASTHLLSISLVSLAAKVQLKLSVQRVKMLHEKKVSINKVTTKRWSRRLLTLVLFSISHRRRWQRKPDERLQLWSKRASSRLQGSRPKES